MTARAVCLGLGVGAGVGAITRVAATAVHFPEIFGQPYMALWVGIIGAVIGGVAAVTGRILWAALVGGALSALVFGGVLSLGALFAYLGVSGPGEPVALPPLWEVVIIGAIPGAIGAWAEQVAAKRSKVGDRKLPSAAPAK
jgi:hypothetical protein